MNLSQKSPYNFTCTNCNYNSNSKKDYNKHLLTLKHINTMKYNDFGAKIPKDKLFTCECGKSYPYKASLYNHRKKCVNREKTQLIEKEDDMSYKDMFIKMMKENQELRDLLIKQQTQVNELIPKVGNNNNTNSHNNIKQKFNINLFLNEQCKDAITMEQFINQIEVTMQNLLLTKNKGIDEGISNIFVENMNKLSLFERPMHCTDVKRETVYIKSEGEDGTHATWDKDNDNTKLKGAIKKVERKQHRNIKKWIDEHPNWEDNPDLQNEYVQLVNKCTKDINENKVIKKLCKETETPKENL